MGTIASSSMRNRLAIIGGLSAVAFVAPVLDIYGKNPEVFVANRTSVTQIVVFGVLVALVIPLVAWALLAVSDAIGHRAQTITFTTLIVLLSLGAGLVVSRQVLADDTVGAIVLTLFTTVAAVLFVRNLQLVFVYTAIAIPILLALFLSTSATARLIWADTEVDGTGLEVEEPSDIVMLQLDEMPLASIMELDGSINETLFPNFARLASMGTWYRNALSDSIATTQSVPAILSGLKGEAGLSPSHVDHPDNLFTLLGDDYEMHVIEWVAEMCPEETCPDYAGRAPARFSNLLRDVGVVYGHLTLPEAIRRNLPSIDNAWKGFLGQADTPSGTSVEVPGVPVPGDPKREDWVNWVQRLINGIDADNGPTLSYAHLRAPHVPWVTNPSGTHYQRPEEYTEVDGVEGDGRWGTDPAPALLGFQRHLNQTGFLDTMLGRLLDHLEESGTWDDTMVIVVADHGASFVPGEHRRWPYEDNRDDLYRVPLFIKYPAQGSGEIVDLPAFGVDILPTVVDVLGIDTEWEFDGVSLASLSVDRPHEPLRWCCNGEGVDTSLDRLFAQVERNHRWVPDQTSWIGVASVGPHGDLVGRPTTDLTIGPQDTFRWFLELGSDLGDVDKSTGILQTLVTGRVELPGAPTGEDLLLVIDDVVVGVAHLSRDSVSGGTIAGFVAEDLVGDGSNHIDVLISDGDGGWLAGVGEELTLALVAGDGHVIDIGAEGSKRIQVDVVRATEAGWDVIGWAADVTNKVTPDMIYVFAGDQLVASGPPNLDNKNVVRWFESDSLLRSGFELEVPAGDVPDGIDRLLVVAEFGANAVADPIALPR